MVVSRIQRSCLLGLCFLFFSWCVSGAAISAELKIGVINVQKVLMTSVSGKAAKAKFDEKMIELQQKISVDETELKALQEEIEKKSSAWSEETKQEKIREFQRKQREFKAKSEDARFELKSLQDKELAPIAKALDTVIAKYGEANGFTLMIDSRSGLVYFDSSIDISDKLVIELDAAMPAN